MGSSESSGTGPSLGPLSESDRGYFGRLFAGDEPLVITYWVWGGLVGGTGFTILNALLEANYMQIAAMPFGVFAINSFYFVAIAYSIFIWIAIWRSAGKYQGGGWGSAARVMVVLAVLAFIGQLVLSVEDGEYSASSYAEQTRLINKSLPMMLDDSTRLESANLTPTEYRYWNTIIGITVAEIDRKEFELRMKVGLANGLCTKPDTRATLESGVTFVYVYNDPVGEHIADVSVTAENCE